MRTRFPKSRYDVAVVGGGIVGLATAHTLQSVNPSLRLTLLEKESVPAHHQTGRNSGVIHSGLYYRPGSIKAATCTAGRARLLRFCEEHAIPHDVCGKVVVATSEAESFRLQSLFDRGRANGVRCRQMPTEELREREPHVRGLAALYVPETGIVDYTAVGRTLVKLIEAGGGEVRFNTRVMDIRSERDETLLLTPHDDVRAGLLVTCGGLHADRLIALDGIKPPAPIVPFRGEYFELSKAARSLCRHLIYPVPDPSFPFLGVHLTRMIGGGVECGPNAVLAMAREGYRWRDVDLRDLSATLTHPGFFKLAARHWRTGFGEVWRSLSKHAFATALRRLVPDLRDADLSAAPSGVRAQALAYDGRLVDDFVWVEGERSVHVGNAPSPAATASLEIGRRIAERVLQKLDTLKPTVSGPSSGPSKDKP